MSPFAKFGNHPVFVPLGVLFAVYYLLIVDVRFDN